MFHHRIRSSFLLLTALFAAVTASAQTEVTGGSLNIHSHTADSANTVLSNSGSAAFGKCNTVPVNFSYAFGDRNTVGQYAVGSFTVGGRNSVTGSNALCLGSFNTVTGAFAVAVGRYLQASGLSRSFVIGAGLSSDAPLVGGTSDQLVVGFQSTKPTLTVTESPNNLGLGVVDKTGKVAIGNVAPQAKLHIKSDAGEDAALILEPKQPTTSTTYIRLRDSNHKLSVNNAGAMSLTAPGYPLSLTSGTLTVTSDNFAVSGSRLDVGTTDQLRLVMTAQGTPAIYSNAYPSHGGHYRFCEGSSYALKFGNDALTVSTAINQQPRGTLITNWIDALSLGTNGHITLNGRVGINTENTTRDYALAVDGGVITTKVHIQELDDWPDYVFERDYPLMPLDQLEDYLNAHRHLPGIPSAYEVEEHGCDVAAMQTALLRKVEELTLYILRQQELIDALLERNEWPGRMSGGFAYDDTIRFAYDACGNRVSRTLEFSRVTEDCDGGVHDTLDDGKWCVSLDDHFEGTVVSLFPNPAESRFILSLSGDMPSGAIASLITLSGTVLSERILHGPTEEFDLSAQPAGIYLLRLSTTQETRNYKVVKRN